MLDNLLGDWRRYRRWRKGVWTCYRLCDRWRGLDLRYWVASEPLPRLPEELTVLAVERW